MLLEEHTVALKLKYGAVLFEGKETAIIFGPWHHNGQVRQKTKYSIVNMDKCL
jgi:hypothetical protein